MFAIALENILSALGGMALFLYGMIKMGDGLQASAGDRMRKILEALTTNRFMAVLVGTAVTAAIQASGATTVMVVGFVNAGLMTLEQAVGVIMGANIGTTITAQLVAFDLDRAALPAIAVGLIIRMMGKKKRVRGMGDAVIGFGILFLGINILGTSVAGLRTYRPFMELMLSAQRNPLLGVIVGVVFTTAIQSSSATTGLLVTLAGRGLIGLDSAIPIVLGAKIGTTSTALLASIGATLSAKRAAAAHFLFNVGGTLMCLPFLRLFQFVAQGSSPDVGRQIANVHTLFSVSVTLLLMPFIKQFTRLVCRFIKGEENTVQRGPQYLDPRLIPTPFSAVLQVQREVGRMARLCQENLACSLSLFMRDGKCDRRRFDDIEKVVDELEEAVSFYVSKVSQRHVSDDQSRVLTSMINIATDLERIGDHATAIAELADYRDENNLSFSQEALDELSDMMSRVQEILSLTIDCLEKNDKVKARLIASMDDAIDAREKELRAQHIKRLNLGICFPASGVLYLEMLTHLERVGDHAVNIAEAVMG